MEKSSSAGQVTLGWLSQLEVGEGKSYGGLVVFPVSPLPRDGEKGQGGTLDYRTLAQAIAEGWVEVVERPNAEVSQLVLRNRGKAMVLVLDGEEIVGGKQNRIMNATFLVAAESEVVLPVTCVEQGRWEQVSATFDASELAYHSLRREKHSQVAEALRSGGCPTADQSAIWSNVARLQARAGASSPTGAMEDIYRHQKDSLSAFDGSLPYVKNATGLIVAIGGQIAGAEAFDQPRTAGVFWTKLVRSYALDCLGEERATPVARSSAVEFLGRTKGARCEVYPSLALGEDVRLQGNGVVGAALVYQSTPVYMSLFRDFPGRDSGTRATGLARASARRHFGGPA